MDQDQKFTSQWMVNSDAFLDDPQPSNLLYNYPLPINPTTDQLMTDTTWVSYDVSNSASAAAADAPFFLYSSASPTGVVWPKQDNDSFYNRAPKFPYHDYPVWNENYVLKAGQQVVMHPIDATTRSSEAQDHTMAERKRREKLNQRFIALSAVIPGLKKMDKKTVLEDATKYVMHLQQRIETLEKQLQSRTTKESVVVVKKTLLGFDDITNPSLSNETSFIGRTLSDEPLPVIEARFCDQKVLIKVHCDKKTGVVEKILSEIAELHLTVVSSGILAFGSSALDITVLAQMKAECCMEEKELVKTLCIAIESFI